MPDTIRYPHIISSVLSQDWAILDTKYAEIMEFLAFKANGGTYSVEEIAARLGASSEQSRPQSSGSVAVMPVIGTISHRMGLLGESSGGASIESMTRMFRGLVNDPAISAIVMDVDSPGGSVAGVDEFAAEVYRARGTKPITAVANTLAASAAYWIASAADEIVVTPSALVGAIGVIGAHEDQSGLMEKLGVKVSLITAGKYKGENNPFEPMTDAGRAEIQKRVDATYARFTRAVAKGRGVPVDDVRGGFGEGRVVSAQDAVRLGMADRVATIDEVIATMPTKHEAGMSAMYAGPVSVPYEAHGQRVLADLTSFMQATRDRAAVRRDEGRFPPLSHAQYSRLEELHAGLTAAIADLSVMRADLNPNKPDARALEVLRLRARLHDVDLLLAEVG